MTDKTLYELIEHVNLLDAKQEQLANDINQVIKEINNYRTADVSKDSMLFTIGITTLDDVINQYVQYVVMQCNGNKTKAGSILGISRSTMWRYYKDT